MTNKWSVYRPLVIIVSFVIVVTLTAILTKGNKSHDLGLLFWMITGGTAVLLGMVIWEKNQCHTKKRKWSSKMSWAILWTVVIIIVSCLLIELVEIKRYPTEPIVNKPPIQTKSHRNVIPSKFKTLKDGEWNSLRAGVEYEYIRGMNDAIHVLPQDPSVIIEYQRKGYSHIGNKCRFDQNGRAEIFDDRRDQIALVPWTMKVDKDVEMFIKVK